MYKIRGKCRPLASFCRQPANKSYSQCVDNVRRLALFLDDYEYAYRDFLKDRASFKAYGGWECLVCCYRNRAYDQCCVSCECQRCIDEEENYISENNNEDEDNTLGSLLEKETESEKEKENSLVEEGGEGGGEGGSKKKEKKEEEELWDEADKEQVDAIQKVWSEEYDRQWKKIEKKKRTVKIVAYWGNRH